MTFIPNNTAQRYKCTKPCSKHARAEMVDGKSVYIIYGGPDPRHPQIPSEILLNSTEVDYLKPLLGLVPLLGTRARVEIKTEGHVGLGPMPPVTLEVEEPAAAEITIPKHWEQLTPSERIEIASAIKGSKVKRARDADKIIEEHLARG